MVGGGSKSAKGGPNPLADMDRGGGANPRGVQIRCDGAIWLADFSFWPSELT